MSKDRNKPRLGRGLSSLLAMSDVTSDEAEAPVEGSALDAGQVEVGVKANLPAAASALPAGAAAVAEIPVDSIRPNPHQPRRDFNEASLVELAASLKSTGLVQPIVVRQRPDGYELIAGERRLRAAKLAGLTALPAFIKAVDSPTQAQMALVENIQREDLNPIDRALAYRNLIDSLGLTQGELAARLGEDRSSIGHYLRLLDLAEPVKQAVLKGELSLGHAKLLAGVSDSVRQQELARRNVDEGLSVRALEKLIAEAAVPPVSPAAPRPAAGSTAHLKDLEQTFTRHLGMKVQIRASSTRGRGKLIIQYKSLDEFDSLKDRLGIEIE
jgi:ParB family chromosome partitioning protein